MNILLWPFGFILTLALCFLALLYWCGQRPYAADLLHEKIYEPAVKSSVNLAKKDLKAMSWNIAWAHGTGSEGKDYTPRPKEHYLKSLESMAQTIKAEEADIVFLQEVDFDSTKSHSVDQLKYLADELGFYAAYSVSWAIRYLPFPYWPMKNHFGKIVSGGAILSRYPLKNCSSVFYDKPKANPWWYNHLYLFRYSQYCEIEFEGKSWVIINNHLEAFDKKARQEQAKELVAKVKSLTNVLLIGGDFNTTPHVASKKSSFQGYDKDDYEKDSTYELLSSLSDFRDALEISSYQNDEAEWFTFPSNDPDRKLDYLFSHQTLRVKGFKRINNMSSDHLPIVGEFEKF